MARIRLMDGERVVDDTEKVLVSAGDFRKELEKECDAGFNAGTILSGVLIMVVGTIGLVWDSFKYKKNR